MALALVPSLAPTPGVAAELPASPISYRIEVELDPATRMLSGRQTIRWTHPGTRVLRKVPIHLYLNGFAHEQTTWMSGVPVRRLRPDNFLERWPDPWGWNEPTSIRQGDTELAWRPIAPDDGNALDRSLIEVTLARPLRPGRRLTLEIDFSARLPIAIARTGGVGDFFLVGQWFPKIGVLETVGVRGAKADRWAAHQFHGPTEFYADYADYDVKIGLPAGWAVVATGRGEAAPEAGADGLVWHRYRQRAVHDFAFSAGRRMTAITATHQPEGGGGPVDVTVFLPRGTEQQEPRWRRAAEACLDILGTRVGPYPYEVLTVIQPPWAARRTMGMEYPTLLTGGPGDPIWEMAPFDELLMSEGIIAHECAHQYFYGLVGSNEFEEAFLDEGFTEYWGNEIMIAAYGDDGGRLLGRPSSVSELENLRLPGSTATPAPILFGPSFLIRGDSIGAQFYTRPSATVRTVAALHGQAVVDRLFADYFAAWKFRHPGFEDFLAIARTAGGEEVADLFTEAYTQSRQPDYRVAELEVDGWAPPRGRLVGADGAVDEISDPRSAEAGLGLPATAREEDGRILVEVLDPGWNRGRKRHAGSILQRAVRPERSRPEEEWRGDRSRFHLSTVRLEGPAWQHLPVELFFRFADGAVVRESWDGRAPYRVYRFLRAAPLVEARIDPAGKIALDPDPVNNGRLRQADRQRVDDWAYWLAALFQFLGEALTTWL